MLNVSNNSIERTQSVKFNPPESSKKVNNTRQIHDTLTSSQEGEKELSCMEKISAFFQKIGKMIVKCLCCCCFLYSDKKKASFIPAEKKPANELDKVQDDLKKYLDGTPKFLEEHKSQKQEWAKQLTANHKANMAEREKQFEELVTEVRASTKLSESEKESMIASSRGMLDSANAAFKGVLEANGFEVPESAK